MTDASNIVARMGAGTTHPNGGLREVVREIEAAAAAAEPASDAASEEIRRIRAGAHRLSVEGPGRHDLRHIARVLERQSRIDLDVPVASQLPGGRAVKTLLRAAVRWYLRFVVSQVSTFGQASASFGYSAATQIEAMRVEIAGLEVRVQELEQALREQQSSSAPSRRR